MPTQPTKCEIIFTGLKKLLVTGMKRQKIGGERFERGLGLREAAGRPLATGTRRCQLAQKR